MYSPHLPASPCVLGEEGRGSHPLLSETIRHAPKSDRNRCRACSSILVRFKTLRCVRHTVVPSTVRGRDQPAKTRESGTLHDASRACAVCKYFTWSPTPRPGVKAPMALRGFLTFFFPEFSPDSLPMASKSAQIVGCLGCGDFQKNATGATPNLNLSISKKRTFLHGFPRPFNLCPEVGRLGLEPGWERIIGSLFKSWYSKA